VISWMCWRSRCGLRYVAGAGPREHLPDFLAFTRSGRWLVDVRPAARVGRDDLVAFAATAEVALRPGWRYPVVTGVSAETKVVIPHRSKLCRKIRSCRSLD